MARDQKGGEKRKRRWLVWVLPVAIAFLFWIAGLGVAISPDYSLVAAMLKFVAVLCWFATGIAALFLPASARAISPERRRPHFAIVLLLVIGLAVLGSVVVGTFSDRLETDARAVGFASQAEREKADGLGLHSAAQYAAYLRQQAAAKRAADAARAKADAAYAEAEKLVVGRWLMPIDAQYMITIRRTSDGYQADYEYHNGQTFARQLRERKSDDGRRFDIVGDVAHAHYILLANGELDIRDKDGEFVHAVPFRGDARDHAQVVAALDQALKDLQAAQAAATGGGSNDNSSAPDSQPKWDYSQMTDAMRGTMMRFASVTSENSLYFDFPYSGGATGTLQLRYRPDDGVAVMLEVSKGQFMCGGFGDGDVSAKFDDGPVEHYSCAEASDGSTNILFIRGEKRFVNHLRKSKMVVIEAEFFQAGRQQLVFDTAGLKLCGNVLPDC